MTGTESKDVDFRLDQSWTPPSQKSNLFHLQLQTIDHWHGLWEFFLNLFHERAVCHLLKPSFSLSQLSSSSKNPYTSIHHSDHQPQKLFIKTLPSHIGKKKKKSVFNKIQRNNVLHTVHSRSSYFCLHHSVVKLSWLHHQLRVIETILHYPHFL